MNKLKELSLRLHAVSVMRDLLEDKVIKALMNFLDLADEANEADKVDAYTFFVSELYKTSEESLSDYVKKIVFESENVYVKLKGKGEVPSAVLSKSLENELKTFDEVASLSAEELLSEFDFLPRYYTGKCNISKEYIKRLDNISKYGYGIYAKYRMFYIGEDGQITPVQNPDETKLSDLIDYEREQKVIMDNTKALLSGKPAANILLTGDAGTGKSSTVKAVVNELCDNGLRIIEVRKEQLHGIPKILDELNTNPLKFILFIDDLSFTKDDDNFSALKAILEGSVSAKSNNVVIYATSNRRHLVKESFSDREGDDVHFNDTMQEILSLSERFGIQLTFSRPDKATYLDIVHNLADKQGIAYDTEKLDTAAEKFALKRGTRSARAAKQFIDGIVAGSITDIR
ncbi:MAG: ATP-binding protein [Clostridia bacterium]|nr:ATP-binding protein [Clostridia bacterium]